MTDQFKFRTRFTFYCADFRLRKLFLGNGEKSFLGNLN